MHSSDARTWTRHTWAEAESATPHCVGVVWVSRHPHPIKCLATQKESRASLQTVDAICTPSSPALFSLWLIRPPCCISWLCFLTHLLFPLRPHRRHHLTPLPHHMQTIFFIPISTCPTRCISPIFNSRAWFCTGRYRHLSRTCHHSCGLAAGK